MVAGRPSTRIGTLQVRSGGSGRVGAIQWVRWSCHATLPWPPTSCHSGAAVASAVPGSTVAPNRLAFSQRAGERSFCSTVPSGAMCKYGSPL